jgi:hypothetical protein
MRQHAGFSTTREKNCARRRRELSYLADMRQRCSSRASSERAACPPKLNPGLCAVAENLHAWFHPTRIIECAGQDEQDPWKRRSLIENSRAAFWAKAAEQGVAAITLIHVGLQLTLHRQSRLWHTDDNGECAAGLYFGNFGNGTRR